MSIIDRLSRGIALARASGRVMRREPSLAVFPLLSAGAVVVALVVTGLLTGLVGLGASLTLGEGVNGGVAVVSLFIVYFVGTVVATFFNAALIHNAMTVLRGADPSLRDGLAAAWSVKGRIAAWGVVAATVGVLISQLEDRGPVGELLGRLFAIGWALATFFIVPVLVFEERSVRDALTRSGTLFRDTWGETAGSSLGVGLLAVIAVLVGVGTLVVALTVAGALALVWIVLFVGYLIAVALIASALSGVARTALYLYATEGRLEFDGIDVAGVFGPDGQTGRQEPSRTI